MRSAYWLTNWQTHARHMFGGKYDWRWLCKDFSVDTTCFLLYKLYLGKYFDRSIFPLVDQLERALYNQNVKKYVYLSISSASYRVLCRMNFFDTTNKRGIFCEQFLRIVSYFLFSVWSRGLLLTDRNRRPLKHFA